METYTRIGSQPTFSQCGYLVADYPAGTEAIDGAVGMMVRLKGSDTVIEEQTLSLGLSNSLLAFIEDEILSVWGAELKGIGLYRVLCLRGRFGTVPAMHATGTEVFIMPKSGLVPIRHPHLQVGNTARFKVAVFKANRAADLSAVDPIEVAVTGKVFQALQPSNLRVDGKSIAPNYASGGGIRIDWSLPDYRSALAQAAHLSFVSLVEFLDGSGTVQGWRQVSTSYLRLTNAELVGLLGGVEIDFRLRLRTKSLAREFSLYSDPIDVSVKKL